MSQTSTRYRRTGAAGVATGALVASALLFAPSAQAADVTVTDVRESQIAASPQAGGGYHHEGTGSFQIINSGLELTGQSAFVRQYTNNTAEPLDGTQTNIADLNTLSASTITSTGSPVVLKAFVYSDQITTADQLTTLTPEGAPTGDWISSTDIGEAVNAGEPAPLSTIVTAIGTKYRVKSFGAFSASGYAVVSDLTVANIKYTFKNNTPVLVDKTVSTKLNTAVTIPLTGTDVDGNPLVYKDPQPVGGAATITGNSLVFTPAKNFTGSASVKYTVDDARGGIATGTVTIKVEKSKGKVDIYRIHPTKASVRSTVYVYASIFTDGVKAKKGTTVRVYAKGKLVGTSKVNSSGKVKVKLPERLPAGNATLKVTQVGSTVLSGGTDSIKIKVRK